MIRLAQLVFAPALLAASVLPSLSAPAERSGGTAPRPPAGQTVAHTIEVAERGFAHFKQGLATGQWQPFFDMLADDFVFYFPQGKYKGRNEGKARAQEFFTFVTTVYAGGLHITDRYRMTANETTVVFEFEDEGSLRGEAYRNRVAISWDIRGDRIAAYREYFGSDGK